MFVDVAEIAVCDRFAGASRIRGGSLRSVVASLLKGEARRLELVIVGLRL